MFFALIVKNPKRRKGRLRFPSSGRTPSCDSWPPQTEKLQTLRLIFLDFLFGALLERRYHLRVKEGGQTRTVRLSLLIIIILLIIFSSVFPYRRTAPARVESFMMTTFQNALAPPPPR